MKEIKIKTMQGIGDIFWVYQKISPYVDKIHFQILIFDDSIVQKRASEWLKLFPKVSSCEFNLVSNAEYKEIAKSRYKIDEVLNSFSNDYIPYCINSFLEDGVRIDEIDNGEVEWNIDLRLETVELPFDKYVSLYVSGCTKQLCPILLGAWGLDDWADLLFGVYKKYNFNYPVVLIGASYDEEAINDMGLRLKNNGIKSHIYLQQSPSKVLSLIKNSELFIGFQSGLNILADNFDTKQIMLYYNMLKDMKYTWCKRENIATKFHAFTFFQDIDEILEELPEII